MVTWNMSGSEAKHDDPILLNLTSWIHDKNDFANCSLIRRFCKGRWVTQLRRPTPRHMEPTSMIPGRFQKRPHTKVMVLFDDCQQIPPTRHLCSAVGGCYCRCAYQRAFTRSHASSPTSILLQHVLRGLLVGTLIVQDSMIWWRHIAPLKYCKLEIAR
ncbi:uncharacterized protein PV06_05583 [Exophiala oligosperma]|uniref:Uncharacterized protein n=1 Tax=Exophiala oligosperma TaxID=215243 RepID=A0A0D2BWZ6_9EURO|nr:uncharacterized protein PV06_05583 [Exophiala oligosperma]KIW41992.1 hypothetical protein PV06_05583 [Exophiala oligosperma]